MVHRNLRQQLTKLKEARIWLTPDLLSGLAGDRTLTAKERKELRGFRRRRGSAFYSDLLFVLCHQYFAPDQAEALWKELLAHRLELENQLGRSISIIAAAADYLTRERPLLHQPTLMPSSTVEQVVSMALTDALTGLYDHGAFEQRLRDEVLRHRRYGDSFAILLIDLDDFKAINDDRGHPYGDRVLQKVARVLTETVRDTDMVARYGGEEFVVIAHRTPRAEARLLAERAHRNIARRFRRSCRLTASLGLAVCPHHGDTSEQLLAAADQALYRAKAGGKDRFEIAAPRRHT